jgi:hypothetical protein
MSPLVNLSSAVRACVTTPSGLLTGQWLSHLQQGGIQFVQAGLHPFSVSEWSEGQRCVRVTGRRLCGWKKTRDVLQLEGREVQGEGFVGRYHQMPKIVGEIVRFETLSAPSGLHGFLSYCQLPEAVREIIAQGVSKEEKPWWKFW